MRKKFSKKTFIALFTIITTLILACVFLAASIIENNKNKTITSEVINRTDVYDEKYYQALLDDKINLNDLKFIQNSDGENTFTLIGFIQASQQFSDFFKTLDLSQYNTSDHTITRIAMSNADLEANKTAGNLDQTNYEFTIYMRPYIRALIIPNTVIEITEESLFGFGSLEYLSTPFIGTERGSSAAGLKLGLSASSKPLVTMFSTSNESTFMGHVADEEGNLTSETYPSSIAYWYEEEQPLQKPYTVPSKLTKLVITDETSLGNHALFNINSLISIDITASPDADNFTIGTYCFADNLNLQYVVLPQTNVSFYGDSHFNHDPQLRNIELPYQLTSIPKGMFQSDENLRTVIIPDSIIDIGELAFSGCSQLRYLLRKSSTGKIISTYSGSNLITIEKNEYELVVSSGTLTDKLDLPSNLKTIARQSFKGCIQITSIIVPNTVDYIGYEAFNQCGSLHTISLPFVGGHRGTTQHNTTIAGCDGKDTCNLFGHIFGETSNPAYDVQITQKVKNPSTDPSASEEDKNPAGGTYAIPKLLRTVYITNDTEIALNAFQNCNILTTISISDTVTKINEGALNGCTGLVNLTIPFMGITATGKEHFGTIFGTNPTGGLIDLASGYYVPESLKTIRITNQQNIYSNQLASLRKIETVEISDETNTIQEAVFYDNPSLKTLYVPFVGVQRGIYSNNYWWWKDVQWRNTLQWMFSSTKHLDNTYANRTLAHYEEYVKYIPKSLETVYITSETRINYYGLRNFCSIKNLHIYSGNTNKAGTKFELEYMEDSFLGGCSSLETLDVPYIGCDINNTTISSAKYTLGHFFGYYAFSDEYSKAKTRTQYAVSNFSTHYIPSTLTGVTVTSSAAKITADMFKDCKSLLSVNFTDADIQSLGDYAFYGCTGLNTVLAPKASYTTVGNYAFYKCINIHNINAVIPDTVKIIGNYAFAGSSVGDNTNPIDLTRFNEIGNYAFYNCMKINQINITNNITRLGEGVFQDCQYLTDVTLTKKLVSKNLFKNCYSLKKIDLRDITEIPDGLFDGDYNLLYDTKFSDDVVDGLIIDKETSKIGRRAFYNCSSLQQFDIFSSLDFIDEYAFAGCTGLEKMHMLKEVSTINAHAWDDCDPNFYFTVDIATEDWPSGWITNWNCGYPVYAPNDMTDQIYVYEYNYYHQGYIIVGIQEDVTLSGIIRIPSSHDGLPVWGVSNLGILNDNGTPDNTTDDYWENKISSQSGITAVIIPKSIYYLDSMVFNNGNRVDLYFEETRANVQNLFNEDITVDGKKKSWEPFKAEDSFIEGGLVFYGENWQYGPFTASSQVPYVKVSSLVFNYSFITTVYNGYEIKADEITEILLPGYAVTSQDLGISSKSLSLNDKTFVKENVDVTQYEYFGFDPTEMFTYSYANNIEAGQARVTATLNDEYKDYLAALEEFGEHLIYLTGSRTQTFTIQKAQIDVYMNSANVEYVGSGDETEMIMTPTTYTTHISTVYDENHWYNTNWNGLVDGLQYFNATFAAQIRTTGTKAGIYRFNSFQDGEFVPFTNGSGGFVFDYIFIRRSGADITRNFNIFLYLEVEIQKRDVMFDWTDAEYDQNNQCYQTYYNGSTPALPGAKAIDYLTFKEDPTVRKAVNYCEVKVATSGVSTLIPSASKYQAYAYLRDSNNFRLVDELGNPIVDNPIVIDGVQRTEYKKTDFIIGKGKIEIEIQAKRVISPTETCWSYDFKHTQGSAANLYRNRTADNTFKITGIGTDTIFSGRLVTTHDKNTIYEWDSQNQYKVIWEKTLREGSTSILADYHLYRKELNGDNYEYIAEDNYYDVIVKGITVVVEYADMTQYIDYYVSYADGTKEKKLPITETNNIASSGRNLVLAETNVNGNDYIIYVKVRPESGLTGIHYPTINYFHDDIEDASSSTPMQFKEPDREYSVGIFIEGSSHHFIDYNRSLLLNTHKSNVTFMDEPLTKVYDRLQLDLIKDKIITDIATEQIEYMNSTPGCLNFYNYNDQVNALPTAPVEVGTYRFKLYLPETAYYKGVGQSLEAPQSFIVSIDKREIVIDLTGETTIFTDEDFTKNSRKYNGSPQKFTPDSDKLVEQGYLLGEDLDLGLAKDEFVGYFETAGTTPAVYEPKDILKYWSVVNSATGLNVSKNYKVTLINSYEIKNLEFTITEHDYIAEYDGSYHITYVSVGTENIGDKYTIYYSKDNMFEGEYKDIKWNKAITTPFGRSTPTDEPLTYYYAVVGENYTMVTGDLTIDIQYLTIKKNDPAKTVIENEPGDDSILDDEMTYVVGYTGEYQYYIVTVDEPWYATVYYSLDKTNWTTEPFSLRDCNDENPLKIYYRIEAEYYNTDYSRRELVDSLAHEPVLFVVTENMYPSLSSDNYSVLNKEVEYNGQKHGLDVNVTPPGNAEYIVHYSLDGIEWTLSPIEYVDTGEYEIYVRISVKGYKTIIIPKVKLTITKLTFEGISVENTTTVYDGKNHTVKINGLTLENGIYYYGTGDDKIPVQVLSTTSENVYNAGKGYQTLQSFKDVSIAPYKLWVMIKANNYNDLLLATGNGEGLVTITKASADDIIFNYEEKQLQYTGVDFDINDLGIVTNHDKKPIIKIYAVNYDPVANKDWIDTDILVSNPTELGKYAFTIQYPDSFNCAQLTKGADPDFLYFTIVQRVVDVNYLEVMTYTGKELTPIISIISHTKDVFGYNYDPVNGTPDTMFDVGEYQYKITLNPQNPNYILNPLYETITIKVEKIHLDLDFPLYQKAYDGEIFNKTGKTVTWNGDVNLESLIPGHIFECTITSQYAYKNDYYYSESPYASNLANVEWDIYVYGVNNEKISVKDEFYTYNVSAHIKITNPIIDASNIKPTEVKFDGYPHTITIMDKLSALMAGATVTFREDPSQPYMINPVSKTYASTYNIGFKITKSGWESYEGTTQLKILTSDLAIMIDDVSTEGDYQIYDGTEKQITYTVAVKDGDSTIQLNPEFYDNFIVNPDSTKSPGEVRYYKTTNVSLGELNGLYSSFNPETSKNTNVYKKGASAMVDAGKYYAVVCYYAITGQWNVSYAIKEVEIEQRPISIEVPGGVQIEKVYDKKPISFGLGNANIDKTNLIVGHDIDLAKKSSYSVKTNSANANSDNEDDGNYYYNPLTGFVFEYMKITNFDGKDVTSNYRPVLGTNVKVRINRAYLKASDFIVQGLTRSYDGTIAAPTVKTPSDGALSYIFKNADGVIYVDADGKPKDQKEVGTYYVTASIATGTNYYGSNFTVDLPQQEVEVVITPAIVTVDWEKTSLQFNGDLQAPTASIKTFEKNVIGLDIVQDLEVYFLDDEDGVDVESYAKVAAGKYIAFARFSTESFDAEETAYYEKNYALAGDYSYFLITSKTYTIVLGNEENGYKITDITEGQTEWITHIDSSNIQNFPSTLSIKSKIESADGVAQLRTINGKPGIYNEISQFDTSDIRVFMGAEEVTESISFDIFGSVVLQSKAIYVTPLDKQLVYIPQGHHLVDNQLYIIENLPANRVNVSFDVNGVHQVNSDYLFTNVGVYDVKFYFSDTQGTFDNTSLDVTVEIVQATSTLVFDEAINNFTYNGSPISVSVNSTSFNGGNYSTLEYEFYVVNDDETTTYVGDKNNPPIDAGNYIVKVTNSADYDSNIVKNYTVLDEMKSFTIKPRKVTIKHNLDVTLNEEQTSVNYTSADSKMKATGGMVGADEITYSIKSANNVNLGLTSYRYSGLFYFGNTRIPGNPVVPPQDKEFTVRAENGLDYNFILRYQVIDMQENNYRTECDGITRADISQNYYVDYELSLSIHYQNITGYTVAGYTGAFDGLDHHGSVTIKDPNVPVVQRFAFSSQALNQEVDNVSVFDSIDHAKLTYNKPGEYKIFYKLSALSGLYEPLVGSVTITISKVEREGLVIDSPTSKTYDGTPMYSKWINNCNYYLPHYTFTKKTINGVTLDDNIEAYGDKIKISYYIPGSTATVDPEIGCVNAASYTYALTLPETDYYLASVITNESFTIAAKIILVKDKDVPYVTNYAKGEIAYVNNISNNSESNYVVTFADDSLIPENMTITGIFQTTSGAAGTYLGSNGSGNGDYGLKWFSNPVVKIGDLVVTGNYSVSLANASITISKGKMNYSIAINESIYKGQVTYSVEPSGMDYWIVETYYDGVTTFSINPQYHLSLVTPSSYTSFSYSENGADNTWGSNGVMFSQLGVGQKTFYIRITANNYETVIAKVTIKVKATQATLSLKPGTGFGVINEKGEDIFEYTGNQVGLLQYDTDFITNNNELNGISDYVFTFHKYNENDEPEFFSQHKYVNGWKVDPTCQYTTPRNIGKYSVTITQAETENFSQAILVHDFEIVKTSIGAAWSKDSFTYNGLSQSPTPTIELYTSDANIVVPLSVKLYSLADLNVPITETINAGTYRAVVSIDIDSSTLTSDEKDSLANYDIIQSNSMIQYTIAKRDLKIALNASTNYSYNKYYKFYQQGSNLGDGTFAAQGIVNDIENGIIHTVQGYLQTTDYINKTYTKFGTDLLWINDYSNTGTTKIKVLDNTSKAVETNYNVSYELSAKVDFTETMTSVIPYSGEYDGKPHSILVTINNTSPEDYTIEYSLNGTNFTTVNYQFTDVKADGTAYIVYYRAYKTSDGEEGKAQASIQNSYVAITKKNAELSFVEPFPALEKGKVYDGIPVSDPMVVCLDPTASYTYTYYKNSVLNTNYVGSNTYKQVQTLDKVDQVLVSSNGIIPTDVGKYILVVKLATDSPNYQTGEKQIEFEITKRTVLLTIKSNKIYNQVAWSKTINENDFDNLPIVSGHKFTGLLMTKSVNVGVYDQISQFYWSNGFSIKDNGNNNVASNYELIYQLNVEITLAPMSAIVIPYEGTWDGKEHGLAKIELTPTIKDGFEYPVPISYKIEYKDESLDEWTTVPITKSEVGYYPIAIRIKANNYMDLYIVNTEEYKSYIKINGLKLDDPEFSSNFQYEHPYQYTGTPYPTPEYINCPSDGTQEVVFYDYSYYETVMNTKFTQDTYLTYEAEHLSHKLSGAPVDVGNYVFVLKINKSGRYDDMAFIQVFTIDKKDVEVVWEDLSLEYTGFKLNPLASYQQVEADGGAFIMASLSLNAFQTLVGIYDNVIASTDDTNYNLLNNVETFEITKMIVERPLIREDLSFEYHSPIVISDTSDNVFTFNDDGRIIQITNSDGKVVYKYEYELDSKNKPIYDTAIAYKSTDGETFEKTSAFPYTVTIDSDKNVGKHQIVVSLDKIQTIEGYDTNYMWDTKSSDDLIFTYEITTWKFPNANNQLKFVYNDTHFYTGEEIKPELTVSVVDSTTQEELYQLELNKDYEVSYANNISVTKKDSKAEIIVSFIGNFESEDNTLYFNILATEPTLLTIKEGKKVQFINAQYTDSGVTIYEDDTAIERTEDNKDDGFYLGHMVEMISVSDFLDYFANDKNKLLVFGKDIEYLKKENALTESDYSSNVGTGFTVVLYTDETHDIIADHIQVIIYGDIDGNGNINANDSLEALKMGGGSTIAKSAATGSTTSSVKIVDDVYYFAGMTVRTGKFFVNANDSLMILQNGTNKINADYYE